MYDVIVAPLFELGADQPMTIFEPLRVVVGGLGVDGAVAIRKETSVEGREKPKLFLAVT